MGALVQDTEHSLFSPSGAEKYFECPGSINLSLKAPPEQDSPYAVEGTNAHTCLDKLLACVRGGWKIESIEKYLTGRFEREMVDHAFSAYFHLAEIAKGETIISERKVCLAHFTRPGEKGTVDVTIPRLFRTLYIYDYKYGRGVCVEPKENKQMIAYGLGVAKEYEYNFDDVVLGIIQPRFEHPKGPVREWRLKMNELIKWEKIFKQKVEACLKPKAPLRPGKWCQFCKAKTICPAYKNRDTETAKREFL